MAVLNPFFRQSVQNPGMDISTRGAGPSVDTSGQLDLELQMIDNQTKAFNSAMEMVAVYAKAEAQIKEDERDLILRKAGIELIGQSNNIAQGYAQNKKFTVGSVEIDPGDKGFHSYDGFQKDKKAIESDVIKTITDKYNQEGDQRLGELLEIQVRSSLAQTFGEAEKSIVKNINDQTLFQLAQEGQSALNDLILKNDLSKVKSIDDLIDKKQQNGSITLSKAFEMKRKWRREAFTSYAYNLTKTGSTDEQKRQYLNIFEDALKIKTGEKTEALEKYGQFFENISLSDILNINQSVGAGAFAPKKALQQAGIKSLFLEDPQKAFEMFNLEIEYSYEKEGKNKGKPLSFVIKSKAGKQGQDHAEELRTILDEQKFNFINPQDVQGLAEKYANRQLTVDRKDWAGAPKWSETKRLLHSSASQLLRDISLLYTDTRDPINNPSQRRNNYQFPEPPWLDPNSPVYEAWNGSDERTRDFRNQVENAYNLLVKANDLYTDIKDIDKYNSNEQLNIVKRYEDLSSKISEIKNLKNPDDELSSGIRSLTKSYFDKMLLAHYNSRHQAINNKTNEGRNETDLYIEETALELKKPKTDLSVITLGTQKKMKADNKPLKKVVKEVKEKDEPVVKEKKKKRVIPNPKDVRARRR